MPSHNPYPYKTNFGFHDFLPLLENRIEASLFRRIMYQMFDTLQELGCRSTIYQAVVEGQRQRHHRPDFYLVVHHHRFLDDSSNTQNGALGNVNDGHKLFDFQAAQIGDGKGAAFQVSQRTLA